MIMNRAHNAKLLAAGVKHLKPDQIGVVIFVIGQFRKARGTLLAETQVFAGTDTLNESSIKALPDGGFVIVWDNDTLNTLQARRYNADGTNEITDTVFQVECDCRSGWRR